MLQLKPARRRLRPSAVPWAPSTGTTSRLWLGKRRTKTLVDFSCGDQGPCIFLSFGGRRAQGCKMKRLSLREGTCVESTSTYAPARLHLRRFESLPAPGAARAGRTPASPGKPAEDRLKEGVVGEQHAKKEWLGACIRATQQRA